MGQPDAGNHGFLPAHAPLPRALPPQTAVEVSARHLPSYEEDGVGADWADVIPLPGTRVALAICHCVYSSATIGRLRDVVRGLARLEMPPDELFTQLNQIVRQAFSFPADNESRATCLLVVYDPITRLCTLACAGHPPPAVVLPDGTVEILDAPEGHPLGRDGPVYGRTEFALPEGSMLALYTGGLVECLSQDLDRGIAELRRRLAGPAGTLEEVCDRLLDGPEQQAPDVDVALLLARTRVVAEDRTVSWEIPPDPEAVANARRQASRTLARWGLDDEVAATQVVVSELVTNAIRYASEPIRLRLIHQDGKVICEVSDGSRTFPRLHRARAYDEGGRGLLMVAQLSRRWGTRSTATGKVVWADQAVGPGGRGAAAVPAS